MSLRIIFMGTPEFAVPSLEALVQAGCQVVAVVTAPDRPQGRGQKLSMSPVKACALSHQIPVLQPEKLKAPEFLDQLRVLRADLQVVVAFRMLPEVVWAMPPRGTFNLHASLLPQYRGAAPINWAVINGEKVTGVTTFFLKHEIDTGEILFQETEPILDEDDAGTLYERLMNRGARLVVRTVEAIEQNSITPAPQVVPQQLNHAPKIFKETCQINWTRPAVELRNFVRGLSPYPAAWTVLNGVVFKVLRTSVVHGNAEPGAIVTDQKSYLHIGTGQDLLAIESFQPEGKRPMSPKAYFLGNKLD